jgi:two-component system cell cycle sensor histidine kinase/response regulator CckA
LTGRDYLQLEVSDTGCGIPIETQAKVFDPFFTTKSTAGGLGLAVVQGIVLRLGGSIHLQSEPGKGTTLRISLPCAETVIEETRNPITGTEELARSLQDVTILVVEDEGVLRKAVAKSLRKIGLKVLEAADGSCAIELLRLNRNNIDVILLDMTIPGPPCSEVVAEAAKAGDEIRVILTSAYSQEMVTDQIVSPQVRGFLRKPFRLGDLVKTLQDILFS